ncbi:DUF2529 domain-containing protein [Bacillus sp. UMB0899]|uniref:DUF2529 domain-containing protein n=1 Tax=Metabacillus schmidteae TaxID=2730405 RepID=UPI000C80498A|nr:DUF2529 domain-containing protein [Metabacillus schmidteae]PMC37500.1 DUF2529 domain-containing protein [Bacillus sp. UMB0899]
MMKIFTTQLTGHFNRILEQEELSIEDSARLLAQALIGEGKLYIYGYNELHSIVLEAENSSEPFLRTEALLDENGQMKELSQEDRVLLFSYRSTDSDAITLAKKLTDLGIPTVGISASIKGEDSGLEAVTDFHIDTKLRQALIPGDDGQRYGYPALMTALYVYYSLKFTLNEILSEYDEE